MCVRVSEPLTRQEDGVCACVRGVHLTSMCETNTVIPCARKGPGPKPVPTMNPLWSSLSSSSWSEQ